MTGLALVDKAALEPATAMLAERDEELYLSVLRENEGSV